jgi:hypothetical protein
VYSINHKWSFLDISSLMMDPKKIQAVMDWSTPRQYVMYDVFLDLQTSIGFSSRTILK